jgi:putative transposase
MEKHPHHRSTIRLAGYDYSSPGAYFITIVTFNRQCLLGEIQEEAVHLNPLGLLVENAWKRLPKYFPVALDEYVIMPNHFHGLLWIKETDGCDQGDASGRNTDFPRRAASPLAPPLPGRPMNTSHASLGAIIQNFKSQSVKMVNAIRKTPGGQVWQRNYYEHVIRDDEDLTAVRHILNNPQQWSLDNENPDQPYRF